MKNHVLVKKKMVKGTGGNARWVCEKGETQWHVLSTCKKNGYAKRRQAMMDRLKSLHVTQQCFIDNLEPKRRLLPRLEPDECRKASVQVQCIKVQVQVIAQRMY
jgi:hypothetical protein